MRQAALSNYEILRAATVRAAEFLGRSTVVGTVAVGMRADLILVDGDLR